MQRDRTKEKVEPTASRMRARTSLPPNPSSSSTVRDDDDNMRRRASVVGVRTTATTAATTTTTTQHSLAQPHRGARSNSVMVERLTYLGGDGSASSTASSGGVIVLQREGRVCDRCVLRLRKIVRQREVQRRDGMVEARRERKMLKREWMKARKKRLLHAQQSISNSANKRSGEEKEDRLEFMMKDGSTTLPPPSPLLALDQRKNEHDYEDGGGDGGEDEDKEDHGSRLAVKTNALKKRSSLDAYPLSRSPSLPASLGRAAAAKAATSGAAARHRHGLSESDIISAVETAAAAATVTTTPDGDKSSSRLDSEMNNDEPRSLHRSAASTPSLTMRRAFSIEDLQGSGGLLVGLPKSQKHTRPRSLSSGDNKQRRWRSRQQAVSIASTESDSTDSKQHEKRNTPISIGLALFGGHGRDSIAYVRSPIFNFTCGKHDHHITASLYHVDFFT